MKLKRAEKGEACFIVPQLIHLQKALGNQVVASAATASMQITAPR